MLLMFPQDTPWGKHAEDRRTPMGLCCFTCTDGMGRIRPGLTPEQGVRMYHFVVPKIPVADMSSEQQESFIFKTEMDTALLILKGKRDRPAFAPSCEVGRVTAYQLQVFEDVAALTEAEFSRLLGATPSFFRLPESTTMTLPLAGPGSAVKLWLLGLDGFWMNVGVPFFFLVYGIPYYISVE